MPGEFGRVAIVVDVRDILYYRSPKLDDDEQHKDGCKEAFDKYVDHLVTNISCDGSRTSSGWQITLHWRLWVLWGILKVIVRPLSFNPLLNIIIYVGNAAAFLWLLYGYILFIIH